MRPNRTLKKGVDMLSQYQLTKLGSMLNNKQAYLDGFAINEAGERCFRHVSIEKTTLVPVAERPCWIVFIDSFY